LADTIIDRVSMTLASELASVERVEETAEQYAHRAGFDEDTASHIAMVCREAAVNAVIHGNKYDPDKHVTASFQLSDEALTIQIADQGPGLDPDSCPDPLAPENLMRTSGRGIFLMRALMDEVHFRQLTPGTQITMVKRRVQKEMEA
jgi:serine/threonine-protein kinase RsbW